MQWTEVFDAAAAVPAGAGGVSILPFLSGERGGVAGPASRGVWLGLADTTTREDLARAAVEAMVFTVRRGVEVLAGRPSEVRVTGGGARSPVVAQMLADVLQAQVQVVPERSASALGAAMLAAAAVGSALPAVISDVRAYEPAADLSGPYERWLHRLPTADL
jgi:xylulokinase